MWGSEWGLSTDWWHTLSLLPLHAQLWVMWHSCTRVDHTSHCRLVNSPRGDDHTQWCEKVFSLSHFWLFLSHKCSCWTKITQVNKWWCHWLRHKGEPNLPELCAKVTAPLLQSWMSCNEAHLFLKLSSVWQTHSAWRRPVGSTDSSTSTEPVWESEQAERCQTATHNATIYTISWQSPSCQSAQGSKPFLRLWDSVEPRWEPLDTNAESEEQWEPSQEPGAPKWLQEHIDIQELTKSPEQHERAAGLS